MIGFNVNTYKMSSIFNNSGVRDINRSFCREEIWMLRSQWKKYSENLAPPSAIFEGKGIVMCAGGIRYFTCAWVSINVLRQLGCKLPIEVWFLGNELSIEAIDALSTLNVTCRNVNDDDNIKSPGFILKPLAILKSSFKEILYLDADNVCLKDPTFLFSSIEYQNYGAVFWPDYWKTAKNNPIWKIIGVEHNDLNCLEQESGQILINKEKCWDCINLCLHFNENSSYYYQMLYGDKDTFQFAWKALNRKYYMNRNDVGSCGYKNYEGQFYGITMVQHDLNGDLLFLHRNLLKWDITKRGEMVWKTIRRFKHDAIKKTYNMGRSHNGHYFIELTGDIEEIDFSELLVNDLELMCHDYLQALRASDMFSRFIQYSYFATFRYNIEEPFTVE